MKTYSPRTLGAVRLKSGKTRFRVWAPAAETAEVHITGPVEDIRALQPEDRGYFSGEFDGISPGTRYLYRLDKRIERPDPASGSQPDGIHDPSEVTDPRFDWTDGAWCGPELSRYIFYELHVGTFTREGTFDAVIPHLDEIADLGVTAVELMPVAQFPGDRNWGYDGVYPFAVQNTYGGPNGLKRLVNACHGKGLAVVLDVVYNHLGPEGNYLRDFGSYFSDRYKTPWGEHINFDGAYSDEVRRYFIENAVYWFSEFHMDALRLDAVHAILDFSAYPFLHELGDAIGTLAEHLDRRIFLIPESALNDVRLLRPPEAGGYGLDAQWNDDFHHALHTLLTGERAGYYQDFGRPEQMVKSLNDGFVYDGVYSEFRKRRHGNSSRSMPSEKFVVFIQNHDQIGNRLKGDRLTRLVPENAVKTAAAMVLLSPYLPLLFMGEEYGETAPFPYFVSHTDPDLVQAVREGRKREFESFKWGEEPPDPQDRATFDSAVLNQTLRQSSENHQHLFFYYRDLIRLRSDIYGPAGPVKIGKMGELISPHPVICLTVRGQTGRAFMIFNLSDRPISLGIPVPAGNWQKRMDSITPANAKDTGKNHELTSDGSVRMNLGAYACLVFLETQGIPA
ncbi:MAG: malto-oligosyltrehalose trehalohydrolase [Desulfobacterales bacterium]